ncbi:(+)-piperitol/(+)-sesamin synthase CYP81Q2-like [Elaeis guineensis]|uniref:(+)-piperitol/(+)-sesamin synthase CYP81Q2-like n=1 Tax=Elaeis guineensis var. tenera TaxID=51953 RepID=UPI003C6CE71C
MPSEDCTIQAYHVPRGTMVFINEWRIHRDPELWDDPLAFKPERFIEDGGGGNGLRFVPFGAGRRGCPGENLGLRMVTYALGVLIQCFERDSMTEDKVGLSTVLGLTLPKDQPSSGTEVQDTRVHGRCLL